MLDPKYLRDQIEQTAKQLAKRGYLLPVEVIQSLETQRKQLSVETQQLQNKRNYLAKQIGQQKSKSNGDISNIESLLAEAAVNNQQLAAKESALLMVQNQLTQQYLQIPNLMQASVPAGKNEQDNVVIRHWGQIPQFVFSPKDHLTLGEQLGQMNFELGAKIAGARFVTLSGSLARLQRALTQFMLDIHTQEHGYTEMYVPYIANQQSFYGTGQLPKFSEDFFFLKTQTPLALIPTAEVSLTNVVRDTILEAGQLPLKFVAHTPCFRSEAGSYGKDTRGMIRNHQFEKVELVQIVSPEVSQIAHESLTQHAETILQRLKLPYRVMILCAGDLGFGSAKTYDLEVWLPSQNKYREISSCSHYDTFQARRLQARWRNPSTKKIELVHTLNGSGLAVGRTLAALLENNQDNTGGITIPEALQPYLSGLSYLSPP